MYRVAGSTLLVRPEDPTRPGPDVFAFPYHRFSVHNHMVDPDRELMRLVVGAGAGDSVFVEHDDIREPGDPAE